MSSTCSGVRRPTSRYMRSRQVQKLSSGLSATSARPAIARWKRMGMEIGHAGQDRPLASVHAPPAARRRSHGPSRCRHRRFRSAPVRPSHPATGRWGQKPISAWGFPTGCLYRYIYLGFWHDCRVREPFDIKGPDEPGNRPALPARETHDRRADQGRQLAIRATAFPPRPNW